MGTCVFGFCGCEEFLAGLGSAIGSALEDVLNEYFEDGTVDDSYVYTRMEGGGTYYYDRLSKKQQRFYKKIRIDMDKFFAGERELMEYDLDGENFSLLGNYRFSTFDLTEAEGLQAFDALYQDCPQYYAYDGVYMLYGEESVAPVIAAQYADGTAFAAADAKIATAVAAVESRLSQNANDLEIFTVLYDYVMGQTDYEYDEAGNPSQSAHSGSIVGVLDGDRKTNSVCVGYTFTLTYLSNLFGVECISVGNEELNHAWNMVKMDGSWYHADATNQDGNEGVDLFLCSEEVFWEFFEYPSPVYDSGDATTTGRVGILPDVLDDLCYARFTYRVDGNGYGVSDTLIDQYLLKLPSVHNGRAVKTLKTGFGISATQMMQLILPTSITRVETGAISQNELESIFYEGTAEQFSAISVGALNDGFKKAQVYYYSEQVPSWDYSGNRYWYYDESGLPCIWEVPSGDGAQV